MNIGVYIGNLDPGSGGGFTFQESLLLQLNKVDTNHQFSVFYKGELPASLKDIKLNKIAVDKKYSNQIFYSKIKYHWLSILKKLKLYKKNVYRFSDLELTAGKENIELIWLPSQDYIPIGTIPYFFTVWDLQHRLQPYFPEVSEKNVWQQRENTFSEAIQKASYVITGTQAGKDEIIRFYAVPEERIKHGFLHPTPSFALNCDKTYPLPQNISTPYIFYPAQFWPHKNHIRILSALKQLKEKENTKINVVFVGKDYGNKKYVEKKILELGLSDQVTILGFVEREKLIALYQHGLALVYPSFFGPENLPPLEAMALGLPVIAADMPGVKEQLGENALLFDPEDEKALASHILRILNDKNLRENLVSKGKDRSRSYTVAHYINDMIDQFDKFSRIRRCWGN
ncbi:MAG TPA: glycosyltransferase family 1 protein [Chitinophagaceae bacterium]|nr:glycosyltransferase family 1 protein [Chitinophagaceae bacterium]